MTVILKGMAVETMRTMKRHSKSSTTRMRPVAKRLEPMPPWNGRPTTVKLDDWLTFVTTNHLCAVRSRITKDENGVLKIEIEVVDEDKVIV